MFVCVTREKTMNERENKYTQKWVYVSMKYNRASGTLQFSICTCFSCSCIFWNDSLMWKSWRVFVTMKFTLWYRSYLNFTNCFVWILFSYFLDIHGILFYLSVDHFSIRDSLVTFVFILFMLGFHLSVPCDFEHNTAKT